MYNETLPQVKYNKYLGIFTQHNNKNNIHYEKLVRKLQLQLDTYKINRLIQHHQSSTSIKTITRSFS